MMQTVSDLVAQSKKKTPYDYGADAASSLKTAASDAVNNGTPIGIAANVARLGINTLAPKVTDFAKGFLGIKSPDAVASPVAPTVNQQSPQVAAATAPTTGTIDTPANNPQPPVSPDTSAPDNTYAPGNGTITTNGKTINVGGDIQPGSFGISKTPDAPAVIGGVNSYRDRANKLLDQSQKAFADAPDSAVANDGTILDKGSLAVGANLVSRQLQNQADKLAQLGIQQQNADTTDANTNSAISDRARAALREDANAATNIEEKKLGIVGLKARQDQEAKVIDLQNQYLAEKDPTKRQALANSIAALQGKPTQKYQIASVKGVDSATGLPTETPYILDEAGNARALQTSQTQSAPAEGSRSTSGGKPIVFTNGKWQFVNG